MTFLISFKVAIYKLVSTKIQIKHNYTFLLTLSKMFSLTGLQHILKGIKSIVVKTKFHA